MKLILSKCIFVEQSAFVENISILDNLLVAIEILHHMKCKVSGTVGEAALKIDISRAYDRVDWEFLKQLMLRTGFDSQWVQWMTMCMETVNYLVLINGERTDSITPGRGLRQGDPLPPYLFLICGEGLTTLLKRAEACGDIHGVRVCIGTISHTLTFC